MHVLHLRLFTHMSIDKNEDNQQLIDRRCALSDLSEV